MEREPGFDELRYIFQIANVVPWGQFYLRAYNGIKVLVPRENVKYAASWKEEWIMVEGDWGHTAFIGGVEYPIPTQFTVKTNEQNGCFHQNPGAGGLLKEVTRT